MRILFYISCLRSGGAARVITNLATRFAQQGDTVTLVTNFPSDTDYPYGESVERVNLEPCESTAGRIMKNITRIRALHREIKRVKPDVVVAFMSENIFRAIAAARGTRAKVVFSVRSDPNRECGTGKKGKLARRFFAKADGAVFQTARAQNWFQPAVREKSRVIVNQVAPQFYDTALADSRSGIITAGRLTKPKNHRVLIEAYSKIADKTDQPLIIYGEGELRGELTDYANQLGVGDRVIMPGAVSNVPDAMKTGRVFVLSSDYEGMPNALMEAMALGLPCVSTDCPSGGPAMLINDGADGLLAPVNDSDALAAAMLRALGAEGNFLGAAAKEKAQQFRPDVIFAQWNDYLSAVASGK